LLNFLFQLSSLNFCIFFVQNVYYFIFRVTEPIWADIGTCINPKHHQHPQNQPTACKQERLLEISKSSCGHQVVDEGYFSYKYFKTHVDIVGQDLALICVPSEYEHQVFLFADQHGVQTPHRIANGRVKSCDCR
jgi:hypothetical protein